MRTLTLILALVVGLALAWVDTRPGWDDTGLLVGVLLIVAGGLGFLAPRRPWVHAMAVGVWIPLAGIVRTHNYGSLMALAVALAGAYAGAAARRLPAARLSGHGRPARRLTAPRPRGLISPWRPGARGRP